MAKCNAIRCTPEAMDIIAPKQAADASAPVKAASDCGCHKKKPLDLKWVIFVVAGFALAKVLE